MNLLIHEITEWCKDMTIKNFREFAGVGEWITHKSKSPKKRIESKENIIKMNEWLESKIKELIRYKKRAEKLLDNN